MLTQTPPMTERVLRDIEARLCRIRRADGYFTDLGNQVLREEVSIDEDRLPAVSVWDGGEDVGQNQGKGYALTLRVVVEANVRAARTCTGTDLQLIKADIKRALLGDTGEGLRDELGKLGELFYTGAVRITREAGASMTGMQLSFEARMHEQRGAP